MGRISEKSNRYLTQEMGKIGLAGLAPSHGDVIANLFKYQEISMSQLSSAIFRDPSTVTALVNKLKQRGFVQTRKDEEDSRVTIVSLTDSGKALEPHFQAISRDLYDIEYQGVTDEERKTLQCLLAKINSNF
jgi:DNA-binding MarR family transcriptional regulator